MPPRVSLAALCFLAVLPARAGAEVTRVWAVSDGTKVSSARLDHPLAGGNGVFDTSSATVRLFGLRNETVAFQVVVEGGESPTDNLRLRFGGVGPVRNHAVSDDPDRYFLGRHLEIFEERMLPIAERSRDLMWLPGSDAEPDIPDGPLPDPLVPHRHGVTVPARRNAVFWIDLWIPRDAAAGVYRGELSIAIDGETCSAPACRLEVELRIGDQALPDRSTTKTMLFSSIAEDDPKYVLSRYRDGRVAADDARALRRRHFQLARRHRVSLFGGEKPAPDDEVAARVSGLEFSRQRGYDGPGEGLGQDLFVLEAYGGELSPDEASTWHRWIAEHGAGVELFLYVRDEPPVKPAIIADINAIAARAVPVPSFVTTPYDARFHIDIFAAIASDYTRAAAEAGTAAGKRVWIYNGVRPHTGTFAIDDVAISPRVNPWIQHRAGIPRWFYWEATYYLDFQGGRGPIDVFREPLNFSNRHGDRVNGDGLLFYPGRDLLFPASDQGFDRPLPSVRLKNWRRGIEDVEYLVLARAAGHDELVDRLLDAMVPASLGEVAADEPVAWPEDGERWLEARRLLFRALAGEDIDLAAVDALSRPAESWLSRARRSLRRTLGPLVSSPRRIAATTAAVGLLVAGGLALFLGARRRRRR